MSVITQAMMDRLARMGIPVTDNQRGSVTTSSFFQFTITRIGGIAARFTTPSGAQTVAVLPSLDSGDAPATIFVINDGAGSLFVYPYLDAVGNSDQLNGATAAVGASTARVLIAAGNTGTFIAEGVPGMRGGIPGPGTNTGSLAWPGNIGNWSGSVSA